MTICMGALCDAGDGRCSGAVVASDRMVTWGQLVEFEHKVPKFHLMTTAAAGLAAGDALVGTRLIDQIRSAAASGSINLTELAQLSADEYVKLRQANAEADILKPRGLSLAVFYQMHQQLLSQVTGLLDQTLTNYDLGVELLLAGVDHTGAHLFTVHNPGGRYLGHDLLGSAAVGSGALHALQSMIGFRHDGSEDTKETAFRVYASKRRSEVAPGVGRDTDMLIITSAGITRLTSEALDELEAVYEQFTTAVEKSLGGKIDGLELQREEAQ